MGTNMDQIRYQVMWERLLAVVEEQAQTLVRTAFSTSSREAGDISAGVFDLKGKMLAQAVTGTPGHINSMARAVVHFLNAFPTEGMRDGDVYITNDPWKGTGHLHDFTVVTPTFHKGRMVALFACTSHVVDIGGVGMSPDGRQVYHEGLFVPIMPLATAGEMNQWLLNLVRANVREPVQVEGDIYALAACNETGARRLFAMMEEYDLDNLDALGDHIIEQSQTAITAAINELPQGSWDHAMRIDGFEEPIDLVARLTISNGIIHVDYTGSSGTSDFGINCPMCYTEAYTAFGVKCLVAPDIPNNAGTLDAITVSAPDNTIVNAPHPCAVVARSTIGHMLPDVIFGCLHQALPDSVPAEGTSNLWNIKLGAGHGITERTEHETTPFMLMAFHSGGAGARPKLDGLSATPYPSGVRNVPVEISEAITPIVIWRKELRKDSGGTGAQRGGLGQTMEITSREDAPFGIFASFERVLFPPRGRDGGGSGATGELRLGSGHELRNKGFQTIPARERLIIEMPGGGGYGEPKARDAEAVATDVRLGLVSAEAAARDYGVVVDEDGQIKGEATAKRRS
ncbi:MAG: hydantoinase B/oxoprolinase family protein [Alphaproteobacteria bacterium]|jgi:N-methylhydantoinase B|nr:5-oxoprolinase [Rhodospirillaceae bacterium]MDP6021638.1 hydantoinase B/oxoprolinase family protein [Alphaproteobacteria bacterium]MDP6253432.1 hydantoinase B/oxoprolinase family protein [Alphaproteobacteria bacterium]MDP7054741.1 hydantoinase B/oxoprolinase family protein [Alphaproteobacteria bacterium]MDP7228220.1 hydantoinase B/oxoprolinase family protein [Alphaproteobacteria bacterium]